MPVVEHAVEVEAKPEIEPIRPEPHTVCTRRGPRRGGGAAAAIVVLSRLCAN